MKKLGALLILSTALWSCNTSTLEVITDPPLGDVQINGLTSTFMASEGHVVEQPNGTTITIGQDIFETTDGNPYVGMVSISFDEFHTPGDIIASGIPMRYDSAGVQMGAFTSAGMFSIEFNTIEGEKLLIKEGETVRVDLASNVTDPDFKFYELIAEKGIATGQIVTPGSEQASFTGSGNKNNWVYRGISPKPELNPKKLAISKEIDALPTEPNAPEEQLDDAYKIALEVDLSSYPELAGFEGVIWQYTGEKNSSEDPESNKWIYRTNWTNISLENTNGEYSIALKSKKKTFNTPVKPVFDKRDIKKAERNYQRLLKGYASTKKKREKLEERMARQAAVTRAIFVSSGGLYNCDVIPRLASSVIPINASYTCTGQSNAPKTVYVVSQINAGGSHVTLRHDPSQYGTISIYPTCKNLVLATYADGTVATLSAERLTELVQANNAEENTLELNVVASDIRSAQELNDIIIKQL
jgi:hypothetical protein